MSITRKIVLSSLVVALVFYYAVSARALTTSNLLTDPGWNTPLTLPLTTPAAVFTGTLNRWGPEASAVVAAQSGISPFEGNAMLRMNDDGLTVTQIWQRVDVTAPVLASGIAAGLGRADLSGYINVPSTLSGAVGNVRIGFYDASNVSTGPGITVNSTSIGGLDSDPNSWQLVSNLNAVVPVGTSYLQAEFSFTNATMGGQPGYVDAADLRLTILPEPTSAALVTLGAVGLGLRRKRIGCRTISK